MEEKGSVFTAAAAVSKVSSVSEVRRAYRKMKQLYPSATHISMAYSCRAGTNNHDDGEASAELTIQKVLEEQHCMNKAFFVVRNFGGRKIGAKCYDIIRCITKEALVKIK